MSIKKPACDIGKPQQALQAVFSSLAPCSPFLEIGCGRGDLSLYLASLGCDVLGIDFSQQAIASSQNKVNASLDSVRFQVQDVFKLNELDRRFNSIVDCCFFHMFDDASRSAYEKVLKACINPGGRIYMLNFAIDLPSSNAPKSVKPVDIASTFKEGWSIIEMRDESIEVTFSPSGIPGTYACIERNA
ncbi:MAG: class I SAM-dependent methyltransferase [Pseudomonadales bacterium]|nr:class I SAM-dependent methyltransferase [Pseudomonadales bacterium]